MLIATGFAATSSAGLRTLRSGSSLLVRSIQAGLVTASVALGLMLADDWVPPWLASFVVVAVAIMSSYRWHLTQAVVATLSGRSTGEEGSVS
jgi:hypothetical protein